MGQNSCWPRDLQGKPLWKTCRMRLQRRPSLYRTQSRDSAMEMLLKDEERNAGKRNLEWILGRAGDLNCPLLDLGEGEELGRARRNTLCRIWYEIPRGTRMYVKFSLFFVCPGLSRDSLRAVEFGGRKSGALASGTLRKSP